MNSGLFSYHSVYLLGIGGIGMSALAQFFHSLGVRVAGYDKTPSEITTMLEKKGIECYFHEDIERLKKWLSGIPKDKVLIIYTPAVPRHHEEYVWLKENNYTIRKRAEILGILSRLYPTIAVAGTHGKTTTTAFITHLFLSAGLEVISFMGGISLNYNTNLILPAGNLKKENIILIAEADEYDRSFLHLRPRTGVITSTEPDHLDIYQNESSIKEGFRHFASLCAEHVVVSKNVENEFSSIKNIYTYSIDLNSTCNTRSLEICNGITRFYPVVNHNTVLPCAELSLPGMHNVLNMLAGVVVGWLWKIDPVIISRSIGSFRGVERRFHVRVRHPEIIFIDDYAHHPTEIKATLKTVRKYFPGKKIRVIFQPHLFSRTRDFMESFAQSLSLADEVWLLDIYPAREEPIEGINSGALLEKIKLKEKKLLSKEQVLRQCTTGKPEILITMGAGDIDRLVLPIECSLKKHYGIES